MTKINIILILILALGCRKNWIDERPNKALVVPTSVKDFQALLDNSVIMNEQAPSIGEMSSDNYQMQANIWQSWYAVNRNAHVWATNIYDAVATDLSNWNRSYQVVLYANIALDGLDKLREGNTGAEFANAKGSGLFFRSMAFLNLVQLYGGAYDASTAQQELGIPLRLDPNPNDVSVRASLQESYDQIIGDLKQAIRLLPVTPVNKYRPSKAAAYGLLARTYMGMRKYPEMLAMADSCLQINNALLDYNNLNTAATFPVPALNAEVIFQSVAANDLASVTYYVDSVLYKTYDLNDMRRAVFFKGTTTTTRTFSGNYTGGTASSANGAFNGVAIDEVYFMRAEGYARAGNVTAALADLNTVMIKRWRTGSFVPFTASTAAEALDLILAERRKELIFRGLRWVDLKRLNKDGANITLSRTLNGVTYILPPNSSRYLMQIPPDVISLSGMTQNAR